IEMMGGTIELESTPGTGSTFTIVLNDVEVLEGSSLTVADTKNILDIIQFKPSHLLVVDDVVPNRELIREAFASTQVQVSEAGTGQEALDFLEQSLPDLVLMDLRMPGMGGIEATGKIRQNQRLSDLPVIAFTASASQETLSNEEQSLFNKVLFKPIKLNDLLSNVMQYLPHSRIETADTAGTVNSDQFESDNLQELIKQIPDFLALLDGKVKPMYLKAVDSGLIDDYRAFADSLMLYASRYKVKCATDYSKSIIDAVDSFDIEQVSQLSAQYHELIAFILKKYKEHGGKQDQ
ncbi:MAG TPA: response regulator, partial [Bacteroidales bacterium]|nr:response regulator [Bacteroidales bacterium]